jgi:hypothetical protein
MYAPVIVTLLLMVNQLKLSMATRPDIPEANNLKLG